MIDDSPMLFVCGMSRSGTTLLATVFDAHTRIAMGYELIPPPGIRIGDLRDALSRGLELADGDFLACGRALRVAGDRVNGLILTRCARAGVGPEDTCAALDRLAADGLDEVTSVPERLRVAWRVIEARRRREDPILFGFKLNMPSLELAHSLFPGAHFACIVRDPRDVVVSHRKRGFDRSLEQICHAWVTNVSAAERMVEDHPRLATLVRYEDLVTEPRTVLAQLFELLPVPPEDDVLDFAGSDAAVFNGAHPNEDQLRRGFFTSSVGSWQGAVDERESEAIRGLCGQPATRYFPIS